MSNGSDEHALKRWTAKRRAALVIDILRGTTTVVEAARAHGLTVAEIAQWKERFLTPRGTRGRECPAAPTIGR